MGGPDTGLSLRYSSVTGARLLREVLGMAGERVASEVVTARAGDARMGCIPRAAAVAQLVVAPDCGSGSRGFKPHQPPQITP